MSVLQGYEPKDVLMYFEELSKIPRGSGNTKAVSNWLKAFGEQRGLETYQDELGDITIIKESSKGFEGRSPVILQGHMDMVCQKTPDCKKDMEKEGLDLFVDGDLLKARGTTLGADNGIAVAMMLALLAGDYQHPRIECVFTVDEETGLYGAEAFDPKHLKGKKLINLDSEEEGVVTVSCAGGTALNGSIPVSREAFGSKILALHVHGLTGGHSGSEINKGRGNANKVLARLLQELSRLIELRLISIDGGTADNVIPKESKAYIAVKNAEEAERLSRTIGEELAQQHKADPAFTLDIAEEHDSKLLPMSEVSSNEIIAFLNIMPNGVQKMTFGMSDLVQTSLSLGIVATTERDVKIVSCVRSAADSERDMLCHEIEAVIRLLNGTCTLEGTYPGWQYAEKSPLRDLVCDIYKEQTGTAMKVEAIHAGLECGYFVEKIHGLEAISIGPDMQNVHTPDEQLSISSTERTFKLLKAVLMKI